MGRLIPAHAGKTWICGQTASQAAAHPRSRGENGPLPAQGMTLEGSSPLTRGKQPRTRTGVRRLRLIPAHAGKTPGEVKEVSLMEAHPRSRRENLLRLSRGSRAGGSSPLTRGKPAHEKHLIAPGGLIPAHAGKTQRIVAPGSREPAHPRSRGENMSVKVSSWVWGGSSPLTRGKRASATAARDRAGLIPAHAGKTPRPLFRGLVSPAHPRSRGENVSDDGTQSRARGSSPLTRGKPVGVIKIVKRVRLIPAHAGKTQTELGEPTDSTAHPRSRGENHEPVGSSARDEGSSPLTRGKPGSVDASGAVLGLIPAHAGKTSRSTTSGGCATAHPRSRGENSSEAGDEKGATGSSPLTRGKLRLVSTWPEKAGLIPAHAGKT